ncbi:hypothetical protein EUGRSUZ_F01027 [Eucalyptus grandis]|uniref:Uncharacterized protein n=2 Tax=Eucalyptus grandis TaxID=71139 RepID=A0ACC3KE25_EUCGR|nr:hypothetical protein EUGRSUZ_F01027 [Eucalyptus grandis]
MVFLSVLGLSNAGDTLSSGQSISDGETLVSSSQNYELGFFSPGNSRSRYLGIWYKITHETVVWVANGNNLLADSNGTLAIPNGGALVLLNQPNSVVWSSTSLGTLILENSSSSFDEYSRQSFDYPSDMQSAGMNIGMNLATGLERYLTSWRSVDDPSPEDYMYRPNIQGLPQWELHCVGYYVTIPNDLCDNYVKCGANGFCRINQAPICECLHEYTPKSLEEWDVLNWSSGCVRLPSLNCSNGEGFLKHFSLDKNMSLGDCKAECLKNCSCVAYANSYVTGGSSGCLMWFGDLTDIREFQEVHYEQDIFVRLPASELGTSIFKLADPNKKKRLIIIGIPAILGFFLLAMAIWVIYKRRRLKARGWGSGKDDFDLPLYDFAMIAAATDNLSRRNMIGEGSFGPVYKGNLLVDQELAVKRLSKNSGQGLEEFMNEVVLSAKLQHRNLIGLIQNFKLFRDLKASNILLDANLNPKISDFGLARISGGDVKEAKTSSDANLVSSGYMSAEYTFDGKFSMKSDVFGFGVLILEIVSGIKNRGFCHPSWARRALETLDESMCDSAIEPQVERCIHVELSCVQKFPTNRPAMSTVASMLGSEGKVLPQPKQPGFFMERSPENSSSASTREDYYADNAVSITMPAAR